MGNGWTVVSGRGDDIFLRGNEMIDANNQYMCNDSLITYSWNEAHVSDGGLGIGALQIEGRVR